MQAHVLFLESFYGGSHRDFADGFKEASRHRVDLITLPGRFWKWRIRGAAFSFYKTIKDPRKYDAVFATDLIDLSHLAALWPSPRPPIILYMHENQIAYPLPQNDRPDYSFGFSNIASALAADVILFNSHFHMSTFFYSLPRFLSLMPEFAPDWALEAIERKSRVLYPGCRFIPVKVKKTAKTPLIVWNHRWEFDKNPDAFFGALGELDDEGFNFDLALLGECSQKVPKPFITAKERYGSRVKVYGYVESREEYYRWLKMADIVVSTAIQENFGISVIEAVRQGCFPLLPSRLSYPEVLPEAYHNLCIYSSQRDLVKKLKSALSDPFPEIVDDLPITMERYSWKNLIGLYDETIESVYAGSG